jgi:hypothetical protein
MSKNITLQDSAQIYLFYFKILFPFATHKILVTSKIHTRNIGRSLCEKVTPGIALWMHFTSFTPEGSP